MEVTVGGEAVTPSDQTSELDLGVYGVEVYSMVRTILSSITNVEVVAVVPSSAASSPAFSVDPIIYCDEDDESLQSLIEFVREQLHSSRPMWESSHTIASGRWHVLISPVATNGDVTGGLVMARRGLNWAPEDRVKARAFSDVLSLAAAKAFSDIASVEQGHLDELVANVAEHLMGASSRERKEVLTWTMQTLAEFLGADVVFLRSNDIERNLSVLEVEWPAREWDQEGPDPLGEVSFDSDPLFFATKELRKPYFPEMTETSDEFLARIERGSGETQVAGICVPLLMGDATWGILGFIHFNLHLWSIGELNALQSVASMIVQLQGRFDAEYNAMHDELTGLPNRRAMIQELDYRIADEDNFAVMIIDLDRFKIMNDYLGHASGDKLLVAIADRIRMSIRPGDFAARLGGDEFVFLMGDVVSEEEALAVASRMLALISQPTEISGRSVSHTASMGIAISVPDVTGFDLLEYADIALYGAKDGGRAYAMVFDDELKEAARERALMELLLATAVEKGELLLHYQPEIDLLSGEILAVEALVRWQHPTRGLIGAGEFIANAEETGVVIGIDRWVFNEVCRQISIWRNSYPDLVMRVNMSPADFRNDDLVDFVKECLATHNLPAGSVCIEVTEHVLGASHRTASMLLELQEIGVDVAMDNFGTGFAAMTELKNLPVNFLKLDISFVKGVTTDNYDHAIIESIIRLAQVLKLGVIAEGIESPDLLRELILMGCTRGQGYLIARPGDVDETEALLARGSITVSGQRTLSSAPTSS